MAVKIGDKIYRNEQEQVRKNMKDIEFLKGKIKDVFKTTATLTSSSVSVALVDTNVTDEEEGWLMSEDGLLFAITGNDGTNLLISYYSDLKGPQGESGAALNIDDSETSLTKVWSSKKTSDSIAALINNSSAIPTKTWSSQTIDGLLSSGIAWTTVDADGNNSMNDTNIYLGGDTVSSLSGTIKVPKLKEKDMIIYVDGNLNAKTLYRVTSVSSGTYYVTKVCDFGGNSKLYQHCISIRCSDGAGRHHYGLMLIINNSNLPFVLHANYVEGTNLDIWQYLNDKGYNSDNSAYYPCNWTKQDGESGDFETFNGLNARPSYALAVSYAASGNITYLTPTISSFKDNPSEI